MIPSPCVQAKHYKEALLLLLRTYLLQIARLEPIKKIADAVTQK